jgi:hypothetical protein
MSYLAQPCDEFSDPSHTGKIHGAFAKADQGPQAGLDQRTLFSRRRRQADFRQNLGKMRQKAAIIATAMGA